MSQEPRFPFSAVVGADDLKLALLLVAIDPALGGVLLRGDKGAAKTTLARGLAALLPGEAPFAELPLGATEERVVGSLDLQSALSGVRRFEPGVLAAADGGVLYVDEVNLLADHLVDVLLDVATSGVNRVEREGISHTHPARFVLIGSMNPEEGELRPQLLDRFGLAVEVTTPADPATRAEAVRRRLAFDADPAAFVAAWAAEEQALAARLAAARPGVVPDDLLVATAALCASMGAQGLRADLTVARAAAALAGWEGRAEADADDIRRVAPLALAHRRRREPFDDHGLDPSHLDQALDHALTQPESPEGPEQRADVGTAREVTTLRGQRATGEATAGRRSTVEGPRGRLVRDRAPQPGSPVRSVAVGPTVTAAAVRRAADPAGPVLEERDLREAVREQRAGNLLVLAVDASGSMGARDRMAAVTGALLGLLVDAYQRRDRVALVTFRGEGAEVVLRPTGSVEVARARLHNLPVGGSTPLAAGIAAALDLATSPQATTGGHRPLLVLLSDGRATAAPEGVDPLDAAKRAATEVARRRVEAVVVDCETGPTRLGLARELALAMGARHVTLGELTAERLESTLRDLERR